MAVYSKVLRKVAEEEIARNAYAEWTRERCETAIAEITAAMKGPMGNAERIILNADRAALRSRLATPAQSEEA
jgi:hypothetical protein